MYEWKELLSGNLWYNEAVSATWEAMEIIVLMGFEMEELELLLNNVKSMTSAGID